MVIHRVVSKNICAPDSLSIIFVSDDEEEELAVDQSDDEQVPLADIISVSDDEEEEGKKSAVGTQKTCSLRLKR